MHPLLHSSAAVFVAFSLQLSATEAPAPVEMAVQKLGLNMQQISKSPLENFYQVMTDRGLIYISNDGKMMVHGNLYALGDNPENLTQSAMKQVRKEGVDKLANTLLSFPAKNEKHRITVFTDTSCGYCRQLHKQIDDYNKLGISVNYMAFPRAGVPSQTAQELAHIWCAEDPAQAMTKAQAGQQVPQESSCPSPISKHYDFARQVGIDRTPSMILDNGELLIGYRPPQQLLKMLDNQVKTN